jgi:NhaP-type Na+/H+ or K+/H+ antiporter
VPRPAAVLGDTINVIGQRLNKGSFPSGHTATAFTLVAVLGAYLRSDRQLAGMLVAAALIGLSRVAVGAHWPLDVLGGALMGWCSGFAGVWLLQRMEPGERPRTMAVIQVVLVACALDMLTFYDSGYDRADVLEKGIALIALYSYWRAFSGRSGNVPPHAGLRPHAENKGSE